LIGHVFVSLYYILPHFALKTFDVGENNGCNSFNITVNKQKRVLIKRKKDHNKMKVISCKGESLEEVKWTYNNTLFIKHMNRNYQDI
jgi:hypothetical protein